MALRDTNGDYPNFGGNGPQQDIPSVQGMPPVDPNVDAPVDPNAPTDPNVPPSQGAGDLNALAQTANSVSPEDLPPTGALLAGRLMPKSSVQALTARVTKVRLAADEAATELQEAHSQIQTLNNEIGTSKFWQRQRLRGQVKKITKTLKGFQKTVDQTERTATAAEKNLAQRTGQSISEIRAAARGQTPVPDANLTPQAEPEVGAAAPAETAAAEAPASRITTAPADSYSSRGIFGGAKFDAAQNSTARLDAALAERAAQTERIAGLTGLSNEAEEARQATALRYGLDRDTAQMFLRDADAADNLATRQAVTAEQLGQRFSAVSTSGPLPGDNAPESNPLQRAWRNLRGARVRNLAKQIVRTENTGDAVIVDRLSQRFDAVSTSGPLPGDNARESNPLQRAWRNLRGTRVRNLFDQTTIAEGRAAQAQLDSVESRTLANDLGAQADASRQDIPAARRAATRTRTRLARGERELRNQNARIEDLQAEARETHAAIAPKRRVPPVDAGASDTGNTGESLGHVPGAENGTATTTDTGKAVKSSGFISRIGQAIADSPVGRFITFIAESPVGRFLGRVAEPLVGATAAFQLGHTLGTDKWGENIGRSLGGERGAGIGRFIGKWAPAVIGAGAVAAGAIFAAVPTAIVLGVGTLLSVNAVLAHDIWNKVTPRVTQALHADRVAHGSHPGVAANARMMYVAAKTVAGMAWRGTVNAIIHPLKSLGYMWNAVGKGLSFQPLNKDYWFPPKAPVPPKAAHQPPAPASPAPKMVQRAPAVAAQPRVAAPAAVAAVPAAGLPTGGATSKKDKDPDDSDGADDSDNAGSGSILSALAGTAPVLDSQVMANVDRTAQQLYNEGADHVDVSSHIVSGPTGPLLPAQVNAVADQLRKELGHDVTVTVDGKGMPDSETLSETHLRMPAAATTPQTDQLPTVAADTSVNAGSMAPGNLSIQPDSGNSLTSFNLLRDQSLTGSMTHVSLDNSSPITLPLPGDLSLANRGRRTFNSGALKGDSFIGPDMSNFTANLNRVNINVGDPGMGALAKYNGRGNLGALKILNSAQLSIAPIQSFNLGQQADVQPERHDTSPVQQFATNDA